MKRIKERIREMIQWAHRNQLVWDLATDRWSYLPALSAVIALLVMGGQVLSSAKELSGVLEAFLLTLFFVSSFWVSIMAGFANLEIPMAGRDGELTYNDRTIKSGLVTSLIHVHVLLLVQQFLLAWWWYYQRSHGHPEVQWSVTYMYSIMCMYYLVGLRILLRKSGLLVRSSG